MFLLLRITSSPELPSRTITRTVSSEVLGFLFLVFSYFVVFDAVR